MAEKFLIIIQAGEHDAGKAFHGLAYGQELHFAGYKVKIYFDGLGTQWIQRFEESDHPFHPVFKAVRSLGIVKGACKCCAELFNIQEEIKETGLSLVDGAKDGHLNIVDHVEEGYSLVVM